jgi:hypothetical protein
MGKLNIDELISGLLEASIVAQRVSEQQHIINLNNYFNPNGTPKTTSINVGSKVLEVPLFTLANLSSIKLLSGLINPQISKKCYGASLNTTKMLNIILNRLMSIRGELIPRK